MHRSNTGSSFCIRILCVGENQGYFGKMKDAINSKHPHAVIETDGEVAEIHARAEVFAPETEEVFRYLQVQARHVHHSLFSSF